MFVPQPGVKSTISHGLYARWRLTMLYGIFFLSGVAGLGYQMVWSRVFALGLGHEIPSVLAVVSAFFGGLALGAWALDGVVSRSRVPGYWYIGLEVVIGVWGFLSVVLIPWCNELAYQLIGVEPGAVWHWLVAFAVPLVALLPATTAMGATLPAMERFVAPLTPHGRCVGGLYAVNTLGAVGGTLASAFVLMPRLGFSGTVWVLAAVNLACALAVLVVGGQTATARVDCEEATVSTDGEAAPLSRIGWTVFFTGVLGIGYEALGVRVMSQVLENTIYSFAAVLSVYLLGTAGGAALYQVYLWGKYKRNGRQSVFGVTLGYLVWGLSGACLLGVVALSFAKSIYAWARNDVFGDSLYGVMGSEMVVALAVFMLPTLLMGATFSHMVQAAKRAEGGVGWAAAINTLGGAMAPAMFGVLLLPTAGAKWALVVVSLGYLLLIPKAAVKHALTRPLQTAVVGLLMIVGLIPWVATRDLQVITKYRGQQVIEYHEGVMAAVAVLENDRGHRALRVNNRFRMGSTDGWVYECLQAQTPLLLHPAPNRALFLGLGTAITFRAAAFESGLKADGVELVPEIVQTLPYFTPVNLPQGYEDRQKIYIADARRYVRATDQRYDVIVADLFHPGRDGAGSLYTREHFQAVKDRLEPGGLFCQWLPLYQMDEPTLRVIIRTFLEVFPHSRAYLADFNIAHPGLGLVGAVDPTVYPLHWFEQRVQDDTLRRYLQGLRVQDAVRLFGACVADHVQLALYAGVGPVNTDDDPIVTFEAPRFTSQQGATSYGRLVSLLASCRPDPAGLFDGGQDEADEVVARIDGFIEARDVYIHGLVDWAQGNQRRAQDAFLHSVKVSEDFTTAYAHCIAMAQVQSKNDPVGARVLLRRLIEIQPQRPEAKQLLARLGGSL